MLSGKDDVKTSLSNEMEDVEKRKTELTVRGFAAHSSLLVSLCRLLDANRSTPTHHQHHPALPSPVETDVPAAQAPVARGKPEGPHDQRDGLVALRAARGTSGGWPRGAAAAVHGRWVVAAQRPRSQGAKASTGVRCDWDGLRSRPTSRHPDKRLLRRVCSSWPWVKLNVLKSSQGFSLLVW